jgi:hypothetical protein
MQTQTDVHGEKKNCVQSLLGFTWSTDSPTLDFPRVLAVAVVLSFLDWFFSSSQE